MDWDEVGKHLRAPLAQSAIRPPAPGKFGEYVDGLHVIREANRIFGENGWSYEVTRLEQTHAGTFEIVSKGSPYMQFRTSFLCVVSVNVGGVVRNGAAVGLGHSKPENMGDAIESAVKEAETDALKRALRTFGNTFGLALYEKDKRLRKVLDIEPGYLPEEARKAEIDLAIRSIGREKTLAGLQEFWATISKDIGKEPEVIAAKDARKTELSASTENEIPYQGAAE